MIKVFTIFILLVPVIISQQWNAVPGNIKKQLDISYDIIFPRHSKAPISQFGFCFNPSQSLRTVQWGSERVEEKDKDGNPIKGPDGKPIMKIIYDWTVLIDGGKEPVRIRDEKAKFLEILPSFENSEFVIQHMMGDTKTDHFHSESIMLEAINTYKGLKDKCEKGGFYLFTKFMACSTCSGKLLEEILNKKQESINRPGKVSQQLDSFAAFKEAIPFYVFYSFQWDTDKYHYANLLRFQKSKIHLVRYGFNEWSTPNNKVTWDPKSIQERALETFTFYDVEKPMEKPKVLNNNVSLLNLFHSSIKNKKVRMILFLEKIWFPLCSTNCGLKWDFGCWKKVGMSIMTEYYLTKKDVDTLVAFKYYLDKEGEDYRASLKTVKISSTDPNKPDEAVPNNVRDNPERYSVPIGPLIQEGDTFQLDNGAQTQLLQLTITEKWCQGISKDVKQHTIFCHEIDSEVNLDFSENHITKLIKSVINASIDKSTTSEATKESHQTTSQKTSHHTTTHTTTAQNAQNAQITPKPKTMAEILFEAQAKKKIKKKKKAFKSMPYSYSKGNSWTWTDE
ncbi:hypothetical protein CYY_000763 [Polysphondylium violaceum]|uniref:Uncharacterized protein n=1 Tax=Polysphondylium violaceum TaxID=133409 RepID=A0A8J4Q0Z5_9MYCE|nr:hypothetical protein CYY_000763 [Polysphondylium violaceum]